MVLGRREVKIMSKVMCAYFGFMLLINIVPTYLTLKNYLELEELFGLKEVLLMYGGINIVYSLFFWGIQLLKMAER